MADGPASNKRMRRLLTWQLPITIALIATAIFAAGLFMFVSGRLGEQVGSTPPASEEPRKPVSILVLGDSLARGVGDTNGLGIGGRLAAELGKSSAPADQPVNLGVNGGRTTDLIDQLGSANVRKLVADANTVIISIGGNDLRIFADRAAGAQAEGARPPQPMEAMSVMSDVLDRVAKIVTAVREANPRARIFLIGLYNPFSRGPAGRIFDGLIARWNGKLVEQFAADANVTVVPTADLFSHRNRLSADAFHPNGDGYQLIARRIAESM